MNKHSVKGRAKVVVGKVKAATGKALNKPGLVAKGKLDQAEGLVEGAMGDLFDKAAKTVKAVKRTVTKKARAAKRTATREASAASRAVRKEARTATRTLRKEAKVARKQVTKAGKTATSAVKKAAAKATKRR